MQDTSEETRNQSVTGDEVVFVFGVGERRALCIANLKTCQSVFVQQSGIFQNIPKVHPTNRNSYVLVRELRSFTCDLKSTSDEIEHSI
jgi:hypothetical protein